MLTQFFNELSCWKNELPLNIDWDFDHQMSLSKSKCWYSRNCLHFFKACFPLTFDQMTQYQTLVKPGEACQGKNGLAYFRHHVGDGEEKVS